MSYHSHKNNVLDSQVVKQVLTIFSNNIVAAQIIVLVVLAWRCRENGTWEPLSEVWQLVKTPFRALYLRSQ